MMTEERGTEVALPAAPDEEMRRSLAVIRSPSPGWTSTRPSCGGMPRGPASCTRPSWSVSSSACSPTWLGTCLRSTTPTEPVGLLADLLYTFGLALWTGVVIAVFVQIYPEAKRRQYVRWLDAYEAIRRDAARQKDDGRT